MQAYRVAARPGSVIAPREFLNHMRRETRNPLLHCWWDPSCARDVWINGERKTRYGCWVVWQQCRVVHYSSLGRAVLGCSTKKWVSVFKLDGEYGNPTGLGPWVAKALNQSDVTKRGGEYRAKFLNDLAENDVMAQYEQRRKLAETFAADKLVQRIFNKRADEVGVPVRLKEEMREELKQADRMQEAMYEAARRDAKSYRWRREHWQ